MKFLVDQQLPCRLCVFIAAKGHQAARQSMAIIVTKDEDFSRIPPAPEGPQVVWVRTGNCSNTALLARFETLWDQLLAELSGGAMLIELR